MMVIPFSLLSCSILVKGHHNGTRLCHHIPIEVTSSQILPFMDFNSIKQFGHINRDLYRMVDDYLGCITAAIYRDAVLVLNLSVKAFLMQFPPEDDTSNRPASRSKGVITFRLDDISWTVPRVKYLSFTFECGRMIQGQLFKKNESGIHHIHFITWMKLTDLIHIFCSASKGYAFCVGDGLIW